MTRTAGWMKPVFAAALLLIGLLFAQPAMAAADLPLAAASPLSGVSFDDRPLLLPVQRNFQMAMLTASSELGRACGKMEAYGWRMSQTEQARVNQIFNNTVDRLRLLGYSIAPQTLTSVSNDITLFTADKNDKHFIFLWSAGELGLVMNLCETSAPLLPSKASSTLAPSVQVFPPDVVAAKLDAPTRKPLSVAGGAFTPVGEWTGSYACAQGQTGGTLKITHSNGPNFDGVFKFYGTEKNPGVPSGSYYIYGQYDRDTKRVLINPGKWISRPRNYYNTVIVGSFDPVDESFSGFFEGVTGCTSFEARRTFAPSMPSTHAKKAAVKKKAVKKKAAAKKAAAPTAIESKSLAPIASDPAVQAAPSGIEIGK